jgi:hypothetical protein
MSNWKISGPHLTPGDRTKAAGPGGMTGEHVDTGKVKFGQSPIELTNTNFGFFAALQRLPHIYQGPVPIYVTGDGRTITPGTRLTQVKIDQRRARNKVARVSRRINRKAGGR